MQAIALTFTIVLSLSYGLPIREHYEELKELPDADHVVDSPPVPLPISGESKNDTGKEDEVARRSFMGHVSESAIQGVISAPMNFLGGALEIINPFKFTSDLSSKIGQQVQLKTESALDYVPFMPNVLKKKLSQIGAVIADRTVATGTSIAEPLIQAAHESGLTQAVADVALPLYIQQKFKGFEE